jgi:V/A-type H+-transporting ATPase subunit I
MSLAQLKKVEIYGLQDERNQLLKVIQELGLIEVVEYGENDENHVDLPEIIQQESREQNGRIERNLAEIGRALGVLERVDPVKPTLVQQFAGVKTYLSKSDFHRLAANEDRLNQVVSDLLKVDRDLAQIQAKKTQLENLLETFRPWRGLDLTAVDLEGTDNTRIVLAVFEGSVESLQQSIRQLDTPVLMQIINEDGINSLFSLIFLRSAQETVLTMLSGHGVNVITLPSFEGSIASKITQIEQDLNRLSQSESLFNERIISLSKDRPLLQVCYDSLLSEKERLLVTERLTHSERSFAVKGWIVAKKLPLLQERFSKTNLKYVLRTEDPAEGEVTPIALENKPLITPFEYLVQSFSYPLSHEVDPTSAIAPFFFIFFGIAMGDAGYGLILSLICALFLVKLKMGPVGRKLSWMFLFSGFGAIIFGLITGSLLSLSGLEFGFFKPLESPIVLLVIALGLGFVQLNFGIIISALGDIKAGRWIDVICNQGFWLLFLNSVVLVIAKEPLGLAQYATSLNYLLLVATVGLVLGNTRGKKGIINKLLAIPGGLFRIYGAVGFYSDVLSYSRLMALGLSGGVMGGIMNQLAWLVVENLPIVGWLFGAMIFLFGHALNLSLTILGAYVHSSRLQYLEFFGKFYEGGGKPLTPLKQEHKYTFVVNEREA